MEGGALLSDWWASVSKDFVPYLNITTTTEAEGLPDVSDHGLLSEKGGSGFPTLFFFEPETGAVLNDWWWPKDEETVRAMLAEATAKAKKLQELIAKAAEKPDDAALQATLKLKLAMMRAGTATLDELGELAKTEGIAPDVKAEFDAWYPGAIVQQAFESAESRASLEEALYRLLKDGVRLPPDHEAAQNYYRMGLEGAVAAADVEVAQAAVDGYAATLNAIVEGNPEDASLAGKVADAIAKAKERVAEIAAKDE